MVYLSRRALDGLKAYEYKPAGYTYLDKIHAPFYNCELGKRGSFGASSRQDLGVAAFFVSSLLSLRLMQSALAARLCVCYATAHRWRGG